MKDVERSCWEQDVVETNQLGGSERTSCRAGVLWRRIESSETRAILLGRTYNS